MLGGVRLARAERSSKYINIPLDVIAEGRSGRLLRGFRITPVTFWVIFAKTIAISLDVCAIPKKQLVLQIFLKKHLFGACS